LFTKAGIPLEQVAPLVAMVLLPNILKFIWAPLVDTTLICKKVVPHIKFYNCDWNSADRDFTNKG
jgi:hypothetical protein